MSAPDVSVVVAVYNTMPYLTECLSSVIGQSIGADRLEIIAVDDGSTDGGGAELDGWARRHPGTVTVVHQPNSGGPAAPSNRGLEIATGRYVFFLGADDYLGSQALERLVATADELDADIVLGRLVGAGGRFVSQAVYKPGNRDDITLADSALPWALSNTKLFRRSMIEEHGLRYPEDLRSCSDQPFTLRAIVAARRISVRADYEFYYAVRRDDSSNITYGTSLERFLHDTATIMDTAADLLADPVARRRVLFRHFTWEIHKLLGDRFLATNRVEQERVHQGVRKLADAYLTEEIRADLDVHRRIPISVAQHGTLDDLIAVAQHYADRGLSPIVHDGDHYYVAMPGFRDPHRGFPDSWFDVENAIKQLGRQTEPVGVTWTRGADGRRALVLDWHTALPDLGGPGDPPARVSAGERSGRLTATPRPDGGTDVHAEFPVGDLVAGDSPGRARLGVRVDWTASGHPYSHEVASVNPAATGKIVHRRGLRFYVVHTDRDRALRLGVVINPITPRRIAGVARSAWRRRAR